MTVSRHYTPVYKCFYISELVKAAWEAGAQRNRKQGSDKANKLLKITAS